MNFWKMLQTFLPWIGYKIIMDLPLSDTMLALKLSVVFAFSVCVWQTLRKTGKGILHWGSLGFFSVTLALIVVWPSLWYLERLGVFSSGTLAALVWIGILARRPFTLVYAKEIVDPSLWNTPRFLRRNYLMSGLWGVTFLLQTGLALIKAQDWEHRVAYDVLDNVLLIIAAALTCMYSKKRQASTSTGDLETTSKGAEHAHSSDKR